MPYLCGVKNNELNLKIMNTNVKKCMVIGILTFFFWIASLFIQTIVDERSSMSEMAQEDISNTWSGSQNIVGPVICVPVYDVTAPVPYTCMYVLPNTLDVDATVESEILHRGIFDSPVYRTKVKATGSYSLRSMHHEVYDHTRKKEVHYDWAHAQVIVNIGDKRGLEEGIQLSLANKKAVLNQNFFNYETSGIQNILPNNAVCQMMDLSDLVGQEFQFTMAAELKGSENLNIAPVGADTKVHMRGNSGDPSFNGMMLPSSREVTEKGFEATWKVTSMNRNDVAQVFYADKAPRCFQYVGARLMVVGGQYTQTDRALKYAFLVILLTLSAIYVAESCSKSDISLLNYLLIGAALVLFYLLLLSLCEWIGFELAYLASALTVIMMVTLYLKAIVHQNRAALSVCLFMALIDLFIYLLLSIAEMALLVGTIGLFVILGAAMYFSIRIKSEDK